MNGSAPENTLYMPCSQIFNSLHGGVRLCGMEYQREDFREICHQHEFFELVFVKRGSGTHHVGSCRYDVKTGDVFLIRPEVEHCYSNIRNLDLANILYFPAKFTLPLLSFSAVPGYAEFFSATTESSDQVLHLTGEDLVRMRELAAFMEKEQNAALPGMEIALQTCFFQIVLHLSRVSGFCRGGDTPETLAELHIFCRRQLEMKRELTVKTLAHYCCMSTRTLERKLKSICGMTPAEFLLDIRLKMALQQLQKNRNITAVADECGFASPGSFSRAFRRRFGVPPKEFRVL